MATPLTAEQLLAAIKSAGARVVEHDGWRTRNRNHKGQWGPTHGVMIHHTVSTGTDASVRLCRDGHASLPGPLCHGVIDKAGTVHLIANGRANHAGLGDDNVLRAVIAEKPLPPDNEANTDGNRHFYGFECVNLGNGKDPWPAAQVEAIARAAAGICRAHGWGAASVIGHSEWQPGKIDPYGPIDTPTGPALTMARIRARVEQLLDDDKPTVPSTPLKPTPKPTVPKPPAPAKPKPYAPPAFPKGLAPGRKAPSARTLQRALKAVGFMSTGIPEADSYGPATQAAVARFHQAHPAYRAKGLHYDPAIGPRGWAALHTIAYGKQK